jgi:Flp pilus assembly protein TadD
MVKQFRWLANGESMGNQGGVMRESSKLSGLFGRSLRASAVALVAVSAFGCASLVKTPLQEAQEKEFDKRLASKGIESSLDNGDPGTAEEKISEGDRLRRKGDAQSAVVAYFKAMNLDPESLEPRERIGYMQLSNDVERAEAIFVSIIEEDPERASAWRGLGFARMSNGELDLALDALHHALELSPDSAGAHYGLASVYGLIGDTDAAVTHARQARELEPTDGAISNVLGVSLMLAGDLPAAEVAIRDAIRLSPDRPAYHNNLALVLGKQGQYRKAYQAFRRGGDEQAALNNLGYSYFLNGRYDEAISHYEHALSEPGDHTVDVLRNINEALSARDRRGPASPVPASPAPAKL